MGNLLKQFKDPKLPDDYFRIEINALRFLGLEFSKEESCPYKCYSIGMIFSSVIIFLGLEIFELYTQIQQSHFDPTTINVANYVFTHIMCSIELVLLFTNRKRIGRMVKNLHLPPFAPDESRGGELETKRIRRVITITEFLFVLFSTFVMLTMASSILESFYICYTQPRAKWQMPFAPMSIGAFQHEWPYFEVTFVYQVYEIFVFAAITTYVYLLLCAIMGQISVQFRIMGHSLKTLKQRAEKQAGDLRTDPVVVNENMEKLMRNYIQHHLAILNLAAEMESVCSVMLLCIFLFSVILMCFVLFFASSYPIGSIEFYHFFFYWWCVSCQVGSFCYWGNVVSEEGEKIAQAAADIDWPGASKKLTVAIGMIIVRAQRPLFFTAGKFVPLSMETLMMIVKGSFSYFMVLKQTQEVEPIP